MRYPGAMQDRIVTIIGASGFIGRHIVRRLAKEGWRIRAACRRPHLAEFLRPMGRLGQIQPVYANVREKNSLAAAIGRSDAVINLAGVLFQSGKQRYEALHAEGAKNAAEAAREARASRFIQMSALGADMKSPSLYARTKAMGEANAREAFPGVSTLRPSIVFGPEDGFFNRFAWLARCSPVLPLFGQGRTRFQPAYAGDVAEACARILAREETKGQVYELGGPNIYTFGDLMALILKVTERKRWLLPLPFWMGDIASYVLQLLPNPLVTPDQMKQLRMDNVASAAAKGFADLGIAPTAPEAILPSYLSRYRAMGQYAIKEAARR